MPFKRIQVVNGTGFWEMHPHFGCRLCGPECQDCDVYSRKRTCHECAVGRFGFDCTQCADGYGQRDRGSECQLCTAGTYGDRGTLGCTDCPAGQFSSSSGAKFCLPCLAGTYSGKGGTGCVPCISLRFTAHCTACSATTGACSECASGYFLNETATPPSCNTCASGYGLQGGVCSRCAAGQYHSGGSPTLECEDCPEGQYSATRGMESCTACEAGKFSDSKGATSCSYCLLFSDCTACEPSTGECSQCATGRFLNTAVSPRNCDLCADSYGQSVVNGACSLCPAGRYHVGGSVTLECRDCVPAGTPGSSLWVGSTAGSRECTPCSISSVSTCEVEISSGSNRSTCRGCIAHCEAHDIRHGGECFRCHTGYVMSATMTCDRCAAGYGQLEPGGDCILCPAGKYHVARSATLGCSDCPAGQYSSNEGAAACRNCGAHCATCNSTTGVCATCSTGYFLNTSGPVLTCGSCGDGFGLSTATNDCKMCGAGKYHAGGSASLVCVDCETGSYSSAGAKACVSCGHCTACSSVTGACTTCATGHLLSGAESLPTCSRCSDGNGQSNVNGTCGVCAAGKYHVGGSAILGCMDCPVGTGTISGSSVCSSCTSAVASVGMAYSRGVVLLPGDIGCRVCPPQCESCAAISSGGSAQLSCTKCAVGYVFNTMGTVATCTKCADGYWLQEAWGECVECSAGRFRAGGDASLGCQACPTGKFSSSTGAASCMNCPDHCLTCSPTTGECATCGRLDFLCRMCPVGYGRRPDGSPGCVECVAGQQYSYDLCLPCHPGKFSNKSSASTCMACAAGKYSSADSATVCTNCTANCISCDQTTGVCSACARGHFLNATATPPNCGSCEDGYGQSEPNGTCHLCPAGKFHEGGVDNSNSLGCEVCPAGRYSSEEGADGCDYCDQCNTCDPVTGGCIECGTGYYLNASESPPNCITCTNGYGAYGLQKKNGQSEFHDDDDNECEDCDDDDCVKCGLGKYHEGGSVSRGCVDCPAGKFSNSTGAASCTDSHCRTCDAKTGKCHTCDDPKTLFCSMCRDGYGRRFDGGPGCVECAAGHFSILDICFPCQPGTFSNKSAASRCETCPAGQYSHDGATACANCSANCTTCDAETGVCTACATGYYLNAPASMPTCMPCDGSAGQGASECLVCKAGATHVCRAAVPGGCDTAERCGGALDTCPVDGFAAAGVACVGASNGGKCDNDAADHCSGTSSMCVDAYNTNTAPCQKRCTLGFDDISLGSSCYQPAVANLYGGLSWTGATLSNSAEQSSCGYSPRVSLGATSKPNLIGFAAGTPTKRIGATGGDVFKPISVNAMFDNTGSNYELTISGSLGGSPVSGSPISRTLVPTGPTTLDLTSLGDVDTLTFSGGGFSTSGFYLFLDDLVFAWTSSTKSCVTV
jgi:hypothetical protein